MSEAKFTKGPWEVVDGYYPSFIEIKCGEMMDISICWHATDLSYSDGVERRANAHLMASAPELYKMVEILIGNYQEVASVLEHDGYKTSYLEDAKAVDALLAKARGEV